MDSNGAWLPQEPLPDGTIDPRLLAFHSPEEVILDTNPSELCYPHAPTRISESQVTFYAQPFQADELHASAVGIIRSPCGAELSTTCLRLAEDEDAHPVLTTAEESDTPMILEEHTQSPSIEPNPYPPQSQSTYVCDLYDCGLSFESNWYFETHKRKPHAQGHLRTLDQGPPFECLCGESFTKLTSLDRHILNLRDSGSGFECTEAGCTRYRNEKAFQRKDHIVQHLRTYHKWTPEQLAEHFPSRHIRPSMLKVCHFSNCAHFRDASFTNMPIEEQVLNSPFKTQSEYTKHMKEAHEWTPFSCDVPGCDKSGKKGYFSETALAKHRAAKHP